MDCWEREGFKNKNASTNLLRPPEGELRGSCDITSVTITAIADPHCVNRHNVGQTNANRACFIEPASHQNDFLLGRVQYVNSFPSVGMGPARSPSSVGTWRECLERESFA